MIPAVLPTYNRLPVSFAHGLGCSLYTDTGERYLDFGSGVAVNALGHSHPHLVSALTQQAQKLWHTSNVFQMPGQDRLAQRLIDVSFADTVFFTNSGAEAVELAIKMARRYQFSTGHPERYRIISFEGAFHGRTLATIAAGGNDAYLQGFGPKVDGFDQVAMGGITALKAAITEETAGFLIEPVQGEGGVKPVPFEFLRALRHLADEHGLVLLLDEVQTGMGRTGKLFAHEWAGITPDIMALAKGIGGGFPLGACLATEQMGSSMGFGSHGCTYGGNPLATAVGNAVLDVMMEPGFFDGVQRHALYFKQKLAALADEHPRSISEIRGLGFHIGLKCKPAVADVVKAALAKGLLTIPAGDNTLRLVPPLIVSEGEIDEGVEKLNRAFAALECRT